MDVNAVGIPLAFFAMMVVLCWWLVGAKGHWALKLLTVAASLAVSLLMWTSVSGMGGWATKEPLPDRFLVHWVEIREPSKDGKDEGGIYIWCTALDDDHQVKKESKRFSLAPDHPGEPRVYRIPYTRERHEQVAKAKKRLMSGKPVVGKRKGVEGGGDEEGDGDEDGEEGDGKGGKGKGKGKGKKGGKAGDGQGGGGFSKDQEFMFYDLPPPKMPEKIPGQ